MNPYGQRGLTGQVTIMLDELEQQYTSLKSKVHDLREYL
jgi:hypothetical protein